MAPFRWNIPERFNIGTLTSMLWAAGVAAFTKVVLLG